MHIAPKNQEVIMCCRLSQTSVPSTDA